MTDTGDCMGIGQYQISLPKEIVQKIQSRIEGTDFTSLTDYVLYVLRNVLANLENSEKAEDAFDEQDEIVVKDRLRKLGYLD